MRLVALGFLLLAGSPGLALTYLGLCIIVAAASP
jgi:hypothetical protein